jgi:hypothetical protein
MSVIKANDTRLQAWIVSVECCSESDERLGGARADVFEGQPQ